MCKNSLNIFDFVIEINGVLKEHQQGRKGHQQGRKGVLKEHQQGQKRRKTNHDF